MLGFSCSVQPLASPTSPSPPATPARPTAQKKPEQSSPAQSSTAATLDRNIYCEAEEFVDTTGGWKRKRWGENFFCATFANCFMSRKAYLSAAPGSKGTATHDIEVPETGEYLVLARYEAPFRFDTTFSVRIIQDGNKRFERVYGSKNSPKIWAFQGKDDRKPKPEMLYPWGATENIVWEGDRATVNLLKGKAKIELIARDQPGLAAARNVDLVVLSPDKTDIANRIQNESYLPLDGLLKQSGDLELSIENRNSEPLTVTIPPGVEHSPYWVHLRTWKPATLTLKPGESRSIDAGRLLDSLNDGDWHLKFSSPCRYTLRFKSGGTEILNIKSDLAEQVLRYPADIRYGGQLTTQGEALSHLVKSIQSELTSSPKFPKLLHVYGLTPTTHPTDKQYEEARSRFLKLFPIDTPHRATGYIDVRGHETPEKMRDFLSTIPTDNLPRIEIVSMGDEIDLPKPPLSQQQDFQDWLKQKSSLKPEQLIAEPNTLKYWTHRYQTDYGLKQLHRLTQAVKDAYPQAAIGANFSPHRSPFYLGNTVQWLDLFQQDIFNAPWTEDYAWQVPLGSQQMSFITLDMSRAATRNQSSPRIIRYVMAHSPGNTPRSWRRQFYGSLMHGMTDLNLFEFRPAFTAYTENYVNDPKMYAEVARSLTEMAGFEQVWSGTRVVPGEVGLWWSDAGDLWRDNDTTFGTAKRCLYVMLRHLHLTVEPVTFTDDLSKYTDIFVTEQHLGETETKKLEAWVRNGGHLILTAGAGTQNEYDHSNQTFKAFNVSQPASVKVTEDPIRFAKQDLPYATALANLKSGMAIYGARAYLTPGGNVMDRFEDGSPAITESEHGRGRITTMAYLPGLSYFAPALPKRPVDRGSTDYSLAHFVPTEFDGRALADIRALLVDRTPVVDCSSPLVEASLLKGNHSAVIPLVNWSSTPQTVSIKLREPLPRYKARLAGGGVVTRNRDESYSLRIDVADALILDGSTTN